jgi:hypothetical protein
MGARLQKEWKYRNLFWSQDYGTAIHESGHAVVAHSLGIVVNEIYIHPVDHPEAAGSIRYLFPRSISISNYLLAVLAGGTASRFFNCYKIDEDLSDLQKFQRLCKRAKIKLKKQNQLRKLTHLLIKKHQDRILELANQLVQVKSLSRKEFAKFAYTHFCS